MHKRKYAFIHIFLVFGNSSFCVQIKPTDYCDSGSAQLKYPNQCDCNFNSVLSIMSLEGSHFGSKECMPVSDQSTQTSKEIGIYTSIYLPYVMRTYDEAIVQLLAITTASSFHLWLFAWVFSNTLIVDCVGLPHAVMTHYV